MKKLLVFLFSIALSSGIYAQNGNVGIGTTTPTAKLHVKGNVRIEDGTQGSGKILTSDANGVASWQPAPGTVMITGNNTEPQTYKFITPPTSEYVANCPITLNKGTYLLYYYAQYDYLIQGSNQIRFPDPTNSTTLNNTFPRYIYFDFVTTAGSANFPTYPLFGSNGPHVIPIISNWQVAGKISQLAIVHQDGTVINPKYFGIPAYGRIDNMGPIIAVKM